MKRTILIAVSLLMVFTISAKDVPESQVPASVKAYISKHYPKVKRVEWDFEEKKNYYEAEFYADGREVELKIAPDGTLLFSEEDLFIRDIPANLTDYIKKNYPGTEITDAKKKVESNAVTYSIRLLTITNKGASKYRTIVLTDKGDVLKQ